MIKSIERLNRYT